MMTVGLFRVAREPVHPGSSAAGEQHAACLQAVLRRMIGKAHVETLGRGPLFHYETPTRARTPHNRPDFLH